MTLDILVKNVALWGTEGLCDVGITGGRFVSIAPVSHLGRAGSEGETE